MLQKKSGILLRKVNYGETSNIITVLTEDNQFVPMMVRGLNKSTSPFTVLKQGYVKAVYIYYQSKGLGQLNAIDVEHRFSTIEQHIEKYSSAQFINEVMLRLQHEEVDGIDLFNLLVKSMEFIDQSNGNGLDVASLVLCKLQQLFGLNFQFNHCTKCHRINVKEVKLSAFSYATHGVICEQCVQAMNESNDQSESYAFINPKAIYALDRLNSVPIHQLNSLNLSDEISRDMFTLMEMLYRDYAGHVFKTSQFIRQFNEMDI